MTDQAADLRQGVAKARAWTCGHLRCIAVGSGKGGVGKTLVSLGIGMGLADLGRRVLMLDADLGLANIDIQAGVDPRFTLQDVVFGNRSLDEVVTRVADNVDLLAASSGVQEMADMGNARRDALVEELIRFGRNYHFMIVDVGAGIGRSITSFLRASPEALVVVANEPTSVMDAYALIKVLHREGGEQTVKLVVNMVRSLDEGEALAERLNGVTRRFLGREFAVAGILPYDSAAGDAIRARTPMLKYAPRSGLGQCLRAMAGEIAADGRTGDNAKMEQAIRSLVTGNKTGEVEVTS